MGKLSERKKDILDIQIRVLVMLSKICGLKQDEITDIITKTDILSVIGKIYFTLNQEGDHAAMFHIKEALAVRGVDIDVPGIESRVWRLWNFVEEEYAE